jgi:hypothetical protein
VAGPTCGISSTSRRSWPRSLGVPATRPIAGCKARTSGLPACRSCGRQALACDQVLTDAFAPHAHTRLKFVRYPGIDAGEPGQGVGEHSDSGAVTLILQDRADGLQLLAGTSSIDVVAPRGMLFGVFGRALASATSGASTAARHRVLSPPGGSERYSIPFFFSPRLDYEDYGARALEVLLRSHPDVALRHHPDLVAR